MTVPACLVASMICSKESVFTTEINISSSTSDWRLSSALINVGWNQVTKVNVTVNVLNGVYLNGYAPMIIDSPMPIGSDILINNYGVITGDGGYGGIGDRVTAQPPVPTYSLGQNGTSGNTAITCQVPTRIVNYGTISGGGGGGGGGGLSGNSFNGDGLYADGGDGGNGIGGNTPIKARTTGGVPQGGGFGNTGNGGNGGQVGYPGEDGDTGVNGDYYGGKLGHAGAINGYAIVGISNVSLINNGAIYGGSF